jgi:hypothetical protein
MEPIEGSETSAFETQTPGKYPKENILHKEHGERLKSRLEQLYNKIQKGINLIVNIIVNLIVAPCNFLQNHFNSSTKECTYNFT